MILREMMTMTTENNKAALIKDISSQTEQFFLDLVQEKVEAGELDVRDLMIALTLCLGKTIWLCSILTSKDEPIEVIEARIDALIEEAIDILPECTNHIEGPE